MVVGALVGSAVAAGVGGTEMPGLGGAVGRGVMVVVDWASTCAAISIKAQTAARRTFLPRDMFVAVVLLCCAVWCGRGRDRGRKKSSRAKSCCLLRRCVLLLLCVVFCVLSKQRKRRKRKKSELLNLNDQELNRETTTASEEPPDDVSIMILALRP